MLDSIPSYLSFARLFFLCNLSSPVCPWLRLSFFSMYNIPLSVLYSAGLVVVKCISVSLSWNTFNLGQFSQTAWLDRELLVFRYLLSGHEAHLCVLPWLLHCQWELWYHWDISAFVGKLSMFPQSFNIDFFVSLTSWLYHPCSCLCGVINFSHFDVYFSL